MECYCILTPEAGVCWEVLVVVVEAVLVILGAAPALPSLTASLSSAKTG